MAFPVPCGSVPALPNSETMTEDFMEADVKVSLPLWRWQAVKRKIKALAKTCAGDAVELCALRLPRGVEGNPLILRQALGLRRRLSEVLKLHADLLTQWVRLCEKTGPEELQRGIRDMAYRMRPIAHWGRVQRWGCGERRKDFRHCGSRAPGGRSAVKLVLETVADEGSGWGKSGAEAVAFDEAERTANERVVSQGTVHFQEDWVFIERNGPPEENLFCEGTADRGFRGQVPGNADTAGEGCRLFSASRGKWYKTLFCRVRVFDVADLEQLKQQETEEEKHAMELLEAIGKAWDEPFAMDLPRWLADLLDIPGDQKIRVTGKHGRIGTNEH